MNKQYKYTVCTLCFTFNHECFIKNTLEGFAMQRTTFPVVYVIIDDASTDSTANVIKQYLTDNFNFQSPDSYDKEVDYGRVIFARHLENENCMFAVILLRENHYGKKSTLPYVSQWRDNTKYHAFCEGDDYWFYKNKLQEQVDFLEANPQFSLTCHRYKIYDVENDKWTNDGLDDVFKRYPDGITFDYEYKKAWLPKTLSLVFRDSACDDFRRFGAARDTVFIYLILKNGPGFCFNKEWGVYRKSKTGICSKQPLYNNKEKTYSAFKKLYKFDPNATTRREYYDSYTSVLFLSKGRILFQEKFELRKFLASFYYAILKAFRYLIYKINSKNSGEKYQLRGVD